MPYWQLFYHLVWSTKRREPRITSTIEPIIFNYIRTKALGLKGVVFALNGIEDHIHLVVAIPPKIAVATFVGQVKAYTSTNYNKEYGKNEPFFWQSQYAAFSFDRKRLPNFIAYVENQKIHHAKNTTIPVLERTEGEGVQMVRESAVIYAAENDDWRQEMEKI